MRHTRCRACTSILDRDEVIQVLDPVSRQPVRGEAADARPWPVAQHGNDLSGTGQAFAAAGDQGVASISASVSGSASISRRLVLGALKQALAFVLADRRIRLSRLVRHAAGGVDVQPSRQGGAGPELPQPDRERTVA